MTRAAIGLGSNLGQPRGHLARALAALARVPGIRIIDVSPLYATAPVGGPVQRDYLNLVAIVDTSLAPRALLAQLHAIERRAGRRRDPAAPRNAPRTLDLDLLLYGRRRARHHELALPHPRMHERAFVLRPLADVAPAAMIPGRGLAKRFLAAARGQRIARAGVLVRLQPSRPRPRS